MEREAESEEEVTLKEHIKPPKREDFLGNVENGAQKGFKARNSFSSLSRSSVSTQISSLRRTRELPAASTPAPDIADQARVFTNTECAVFFADVLDSSFVYGIVFGTILCDWMIFVAQFGTRSLPSPTSSH